MKDFNLVDASRKYRKKMFRMLKNRFEQSDSPAERVECGKLIVKFMNLDAIDDAPEKYALEDANPSENVTKISEAV